MLLLHNIYFENIKTTMPRVSLKKKTLLILKQSLYYQSDLSGL